MKVAVEVEEPQVPLIVPRSPRVRLFTPRFAPLMAALAVPVGAILRAPFVKVELSGMVTDLSPEPLKIKLEYVVGMTV